MWFIKRFIPNIKNGLKKGLNLIFKSLGIILLIVLCCLAVAYYALQLPEIQTQLSQEAIKKLSEAVGGHISISRAKIKWFDEVVFEDVAIKDLKGRDMIYARELYINTKTNFSFDLKKIITFDNNLDYVLLKNADVKIIKEKGKLNIDAWIAKVQEIVNGKKKGGTKPPKAFTIDQAYIETSKLSLIDSGKVKFEKGLFDYNNFTINNLNASLNKLFFRRDTVSFLAKNVQGYDAHADLKIHDISTKFRYTKKDMQLENLSAKINKSHITDALYFYYEKPSAFGDFFNKVSLKGNLKNTVLNSSDLSRFSTFMDKYQDTYTLNGSFRGKYVDLSTDNIKIDFGKNSYFKGKGNFKGFPDILNTKTDLTIDEAFITEEDAKIYSKDPVKLAYINRLKDLKISGDFKGTLSNFKTKILASNRQIGTINADLDIKNSFDSKNIEYNTDLNFKDFNLGNLVGNSSLKNVSFNGKISGKGFDGTRSIFNLNGKIPSISYNKYDYKNIIVDGSLSQSVFEGYLGIEDPNLQGFLDGVIAFQTGTNKYNFKGNIERSNLKKLGLVNEDIKLKTEVDINSVGNTLDEALGKIELKNTQIDKSGSLLNLKNTLFTVSEFGVDKTLNLNSDFFDLNIKGIYKPTAIIKAIGQLSEEYAMYFTKTGDFRDQYYLSKKKEKFENSKADFKLIFKSSDPFFNVFIPGLKLSPGSTFDGKLDFGHLLNFNVNSQLDSLSFKDNTFYNNAIKFSVKKSFSTASVESSLDYFSRSQKYINGLKSQNLSTKAYWDQRNYIDFETHIDQKENNSFLDMLGNIAFTPEGFDLKINDKNSVVSLLGDTWNFQNNNLCKVKGKNIDFENFKLSHNNQSVSLQGSISEEKNKASTLLIQDLNLTTLKPLTNTNLGGVANGVFKLEDYYGNSFISSDLAVENFEYLKVNYGTLTFSSEYDRPNDKLNIKSNLFNNFEELLRISGTFDPKIKENSLALNGKLKGLKIETFQPMLVGVFDGLKGKAEGEFKVSGEPLEPLFNGEIDISNGGLRIISSGTELFFEDQIVLKPEGIFTKDQGLTLKDDLEKPNLATLKGGIIFLPERKFGFDLKANITSAEGFKVLALPAAEKAVFYGNALATGDVSVNGDFDNILIAGNLLSKKGTKITIPLDGGVQVDLQKEGIPFISKKTDTSTVKTNLKISGVNLAFNLSFTPDAECEIIFDRLNNDVLNVFGIGRLSLLYDTRGIFTMNGPYEIVSGKYNFSFQNLASLRKFSIMEGSRIVWSGDPFEANINMKAAYNTYIPVDKITQQSNGLSTRYPINVIVNLQDRLLTPTIKYNLNFDLKQIPYEYHSSLLAFEEKLRNDEQQMSRNVSSILVFNDVFPENIADALTQQFLIDNVSNILSNQIGVLANKLDPNLELGVQFGDFRSNLLNNLQLNVSYKFLETRFRLKGNSAFVSSLQDRLNTNAQGQLSLGGELEYLLSANGDYKFKLFSRSVPTNFYTFNSNGNGNVLVSGGNLVISKSFNAFKSSAKTRSFPLGVAKKEDEISFLRNSDSTKTASK